MYVINKNIKKKYVDDFINNGRIFFSNAKSWENSTESGISDILEGTYGCCFKYNKSGRLKLNDKFHGVYCKENGNMLYFKRKYVMNLPCYCLYGHNSDKFILKISNSNNESIAKTKISKNYLNDFINVKNRKDYDNIEDDDKPVIVLISAGEFINRLRSKLIEFGFSKEEILIQPIEYCKDYYQNNEFIINYSSTRNPSELFFKDIRYKEQSEIRVVINSRNKELNSRLLKNQIYIGDIKDITMNHENKHYIDRYVKGDIGITGIVEI